MERPKLRKVERIEHQRGSEALLVLRDPLGLTEPVAVDAVFAPVLDLLDGQRTVPQVRQSLLMRGSLDLPTADLAAFVMDLDDAGLLDNEHFRDRFGATLQRFMDAEIRAPHAAGALYPEGAAALEVTLRATVGPVTLRADRDLVGLVTPHVPFDAAPEVFAAAVDPLPPADEVDRIIALGTDHVPGLCPFAVTDKPYGTPLGPAAGDAAFVDALDRRVPWIRREEIRHRTAISLEPVAIMARFAYGDACPPIVPILCGQTALTTDEGRTMTEELVGHLEALTDDTRVLLWASAELCHVGPAFGTGPLDEAATQDADARDGDLLSAFVAGRPDRLAAQSVAGSPTRRPSGGAALTALSRLLPVGYQATVARYDVIEAAGDLPGRIGVAGIRITR